MATTEALVALAKVSVVDELVVMLGESEVRSQMKAVDPTTPYTTEAFLLMAKARFEKEAGSTDG